MCTCLIGSHISDATAYISGLRPRAEKASLEQSKLVTCCNLTRKRNGGFTLVTTVPLLPTDRTSAAGGCLTTLDHFGDSSRVSHQRCIALCVLGYAHPRNGEQRQIYCIGNCPMSRVIGVKMISTVVSGEESSGISGVMRSRVLIDHAIASSGAISNKSVICSRSISSSGLQ
jgi:hypothetical protein